MGNNHRDVHSRWLLSSLQSPIFSITLATMGVRFLRAGSSFTLFYCQIVKEKDCRQTQNSLRVCLQSEQSDSQ